MSTREQTVYNLQTVLKIMQQARKHDIRMEIWKTDVKAVENALQLIADLYHETKDTSTNRL